MKYCIDCKKEIDDDALFCPYCGKDRISSSFLPDQAEASEETDPLPPPAAEKEEDEPPAEEAADLRGAAEGKRRRRLMFFAVGLLALAALVLIAVGTHTAMSGFLKENNLALEPGEKTNETTGENASDEEASAPEEPETYVVGTDVGNTFLFGVFEQEPDTEEAIRWLVLKKEDNKILLISKYALDCKKYHSDYGNVTWEACSLREWLNDTFYNAAFSPEEQSRILSTTVSAGKNPEYSTYAGNSTTDKIFLLSLDEAQTLFASDKERICEATAHAKNRGAWSSADGYCWWLLRSPGGASDSVAGVSYTGKTDPYGNSVDYANAAVRPAMWITLDP